MTVLSQKHLFRLVKAKDKMAIWRQACRAICSEYRMSNADVYKLQLYKLRGSLLCYLLDVLRTQEAYALHGWTPCQK